MDALHRPLSRRSARTLYNVADARLPDGQSLSKDFAPDYERLLRHEGVGAARLNWIALHWIEWEPRLALRGLRSFSKCDRDARRQTLERFRRARLTQKRRLFQRLCERLDRALEVGSASEPGESHSSRE